MSNVINWFEIPSSNFERAVRFYSAVLGVELKCMDFMGVPHAMFTAPEGTVSGAIVYDANRPPGAGGTFIYLNAGSRDDMAQALTRVGAAGGKVVLAEESIGEQGFFAVIDDTEGNRIGLHAPLRAASSNAA